MKYLNFTCPLTFIKISVFITFVRISMNTIIINIVAVQHITVNVFTYSHYLLYSSLFCIILQYIFRVISCRFSFFCFLWFFSLFRMGGDSFKQLFFIRNNTDIGHYQTFTGSNQPFAFYRPPLILLSFKCSFHVCIIRSFTFSLLDLLTF